MLEQCAMGFEHSQIQRSFAHVSWCCNGASMVYVLCHSSLSCLRTVFACHSNSIFLVVICFVIQVVFVFRGQISRNVLPNFGHPVIFSQTNWRFHAMTLGFKTNICPLFSNVIVPFFIFRCLNDLYYVYWPVLGRTEFAIHIVHALRIFYDGTGVKNFHISPRGRTGKFCLLLVVPLDFICPSRLSSSAFAIYWCLHLVFTVRLCRALFRRVHTRWQVSYGEHLSHVFNIGNVWFTFVDKFPSWVGRCMDRTTRSFV